MGIATLGSKAIMAAGVLITHAGKASRAWALMIALLLLLVTGTALHLSHSDTTHPSLTLASLNPAAAEPRQPETPFSDNDLTNRAAMRVLACLQPKLGTSPLFERPSNDIVIAAEDLPSRNPTRIGFSIETSFSFPEQGQPLFIVYQNIRI